MITLLCPFTTLGTSGPSFPHWEQCFLAAVLPMTSICVLFLFTVMQQIHGVRAGWMQNKLHFHLHFRLSSTMWLWEKQCLVNLFPPAAIKKSSVKERQACFGPLGDLVNLISWVASLPMAGGMELDDL